MRAIKAYAKINLFLDITKKRNDGFHDIVTVMQKVTLADNVSVEKTLGEGIHIYTNSKNVPQGKENIAYKAASLFLKKAGITDRINITLEKNIPTEAGLGGGSSDAAAVLELLNAEYSGVISKDELLKIALELGSDVPFFLEDGTSLNVGRGEKSIEKFPNLNGYIVIAKGKCGMSTKTAYGLLDQKYANNYRKNNEALLEGLSVLLREGKNTNISKYLYNIFEDVVAAPLAEINDMKSVMLKSGALGALMSGSGSSVFGIFDSLDNAQKAYYDFVHSNTDAWICTAV